MSDYKPKPGDRVRVVLEGKVSVAMTGDRVPFTLYNDDGSCGNYIEPWTERVISVEKIAPPVTVFKPGDVVRSKSLGTVRYLGQEGYIKANNGVFFPYGEVVNGIGKGVPRERFTSESYEKVDLV